MKKSEIYTRAMEVVVNSVFTSASDKLEIIEQLLDNRNTALFWEKKNAEKEAAGEAQEEQA